MQFSKLLAALAFGSAVQAHMALQWPYPFRASYNPYADQSTIDYSMTSPLDADGSNFPCKGYQTDMGTSAGKSVVTWNAGGAYNFSVEGGATHGGGSCQIALSYDKGVSFTVIHSYVGSCPLSSGEAFQFTLPEDAPTGESMFAWVWYNEIGNREIYMNCASVTIDKGSGSAPSTPFAKRPGLFIANLDNGCTTVEGKEVQYPDPGPSADVTTKDAIADDSGSYTGTCAAVKGIGGGSSGPAPSGGSGGNTSPASAATSAAAPATSAATAPEQTTMSTITTSVTSTSTVFLVSATSVAPGVFFTGTATATATGPSTPSSSGSSGAGPQTAGSSCNTEGMWNCIGGTSFQQCASGQWSVVQPVAAGTQCTPGQSSNFQMTAVGSRRDLGKQRVRRALRDFKA